MNEMDQIMKYLNDYVWIRHIYPQGIKQIIINVEEEVLMLLLRNAIQKHKGVVGIWFKNNFPSALPHPHLYIRNAAVKEVTAVGVKPERANQPTEGGSTKFCPQSQRHKDRDKDKDTKTTPEYTPPSFRHPTFSTRLPPFLHKLPQAFPFTIKFLLPIHF